MTTKIVDAKTVFGVENQKQIAIDDLSRILQENKNKLFNLMYINKICRPYINNNCKFIDIDNSKLTVRFCKKIKSIPLEFINHIIIDNILFEIW